MASRTVFSLATLVFCRLESVVEMGVRHSTRCRDIEDELILHIRAPVVLSVGPDSLMAQRDVTRGAI
jgi:hypothetical protein